MNVARLLCVTLAMVVGGLLITVSAHETKEVAGLMVTFGAEPEPALNGQMQFLRWRFRSKETKDAFGDITDLTATVKRSGKSFGPFTGRMTAREPGVVATQHIFKEPGDYEAVLTFKKKGDDTVHSVAFNFKIGDRKQYEIP